MIEWMNEWIDDEVEILPPGDDIAQKAEQNVGVERSLVSLVHDHRRVIVQIVLSQGFWMEKAIPSDRATRDMRGE